MASEAGVCWHLTWLKTVGLSAGHSWVKARRPNCSGFASPTKPDSALGDWEQDATTLRLCNPSAPRSASATRGLGSGGLPRHHPGSSCPTCDPCIFTGLRVLGL